MIDWAVVLAYFAGTIWLGSRLGRGQRDLEDYFLAGRRTPWLAASLSIVGTETSTLTFVGVPAIVGANGIEEVIEIDLTDDEKAAFAHSVEAVSKTCGEVDAMLGSL